MIVAIEGIDGAGKGTQAGLLKDRADRGGLTSEVLSFPRYGITFFGKAAADYLNGRFGPLSSVDPHFAGLLYAGDRFESRQAIVESSRSNGLLILDRYVASNVAYQSARVPLDLREKFISWISHVEYEIYDLPRADLTIYLDIDVDTATEMVRRKSKRAYTDEVADIHEKDTTYLARCREVYHELARRNFAGPWVAVDCSDPAGRIRPPEEIHETIWATVESSLDARDRRVY